MDYDINKLDINMANFLLQSVFPNNKVIEDEKGIPSVMVRIPKYTLKDLGIADSDEPHPAFVINGKTVDALYISKYPNVIIDGNAASLPNVDPAGDVSYAMGVEASAKKGKGWHMMTRAEYALIALICAQQGFAPKGNNCAGRDYHDKISSALKVNEKGIHNYTGSGPATWYHDGTHGGIADLNGNVCDWESSVRLVYGELQVIPNNDGADNRNSQDGDSDQWMAINGKTGEYIKPQGDGKTPDSLKLDYYGRDTISHDPTLFSGWQWITTEVTEVQNKRRGMSFASTVAALDVCEEAKAKLKALCLLPPYENPDIYGLCRMFANNGSPDARIFGGGRELDKENSGVWFVRIGDLVDYHTIGTGFRCAYAEID